MFTHRNPKRVAIIGGGEGATLREVLKHNTVEKVVMIEIDEMMVKASREFLPDWNDCSDQVGSRPNCFDDPRAEVFFEDAFKWFIDRFSDDGQFQGTEKPFDVIIMDAL
jgi:spermidine synthase